MIKNADCTVFHRTYDPENRADFWKPSFHQCVSWHGKCGASIAESGLNADCNYTVRIFTADDISVATGDIVVKGAVGETVTAPVRQLSGKYECFTVTCVSDNRRGSERMKHWKVEGS